MKVEIIYASLTGCTRKVAQAIRDGIQAEEITLYDLKDGIPPLDGDIILIGYWGISGGPCPEVREFLRTVEGKTVGVFCTLGYYSDSDHARQTVKAGVDLLKEKNTVIGCYVCSGAVAKSLKAGQGKDETHVPTEQKEIRWEITNSHPTEAECALAAERFRERIYLWSRCKELNIPFTPVI